MAKDLLYRPNLGYDKNYYTEGKITDDFKDDDVYIPGDNNKEDNINNLLNDLENKFKFLPDEIKNVYLPPFYGMKDEYDKVIDENNKNKEDDKNKDKEENNDNGNSGGGIIVEDKEEDDDDFPPLFERDDDIYISIDDPFSDPVKVITTTYYTNFIDVYEDYLNKLISYVNNYIMTMLDTISHNKIDGQLLDYSSKAIKNKNLLHLTDFMIKSDITLDQTMRLHKKLFQIDEIILHVRSIRVSKEQMLRYNSLTETTQESSLDVTNNVILKESIRVSEKKYEENLYALYKYLNSSVILLNESLKTISKQNMAIAIINNNEERD